VHGVSGSMHGRMRSRRESDRRIFVEMNRAACALTGRCVLALTRSSAPRAAGLGASYGTAKSGVGVAAMAVMRPELIMKSIVPVVMAGIIAIYGLVVSVLISGYLSHQFYTLYKYARRAYTKFPPFQWWRFECADLPTSHHALLRSCCAPAAASFTLVLVSQLVSLVWPLVSPLALLVTPVCAAPHRCVFESGGAAGSRGPTR